MMQTGVIDEDIEAPVMIFEMRERAVAIRVVPHVSDYAFCATTCGVDLGDNRVETSLASGD